MLINIPLKGTLNASTACYLIQAPVKSSFVQNAKVLVTKISNALLKRKLNVPIVSHQITSTTVSN